MIKIFLSTTRTQGQRENDFCYVPEDEILTFTFECTSGNDPDDNCGCHRCLCGIDCGKGTTTMKVIEMPGTVYDLAGMIYDQAKRGGWIEQFGKDYMKSKSDLWAGRIVAAASTFSKGAIIERRADLFVQRILEAA